MLILRTTAILHLDLPSTCIHRESEEGLAQLEREKSLAKKDRRRSAMAEMLQEEEEARNEKETRRRKVLSNWDDFHDKVRSHSVTLSHCHIVILSHCHSVTVSHHSLEIGPLLRPCQ